MTIDTLISCMHQKDWSIVERSGLKGGAVIVNQCDRNGEEEKIINGCSVCMYSTTQRGLSRSRNMAIEHSHADICLISDDDEIYAEGYEEKLVKAFTEYPEADVILFQVKNDIGKTFSPTPFKIGYLRALQFASWQIAFRRESIMNAGIRFDVEMGSGTGHGSNEETKFLYDCLRKGLQLQYVPVEIARLIPGSESQWFKGFDTKYFLNRGWSTARYMGKFFGTLYVTYFAIRKFPLYRKDCSMLCAWTNMLKGIYCNPYQ